MNLLEQFVNFLKNQKNKPSFLTVKNYKADIGQFISWFEKEFNSTFDPSKVTSQIIEQYKKFRSLPAGRQGLSSSSIERHISSLRKFFNFLQIKGIIPQHPLEKMISSSEARALEDPWMIRNFKSYLYDCKKSDLTIKNYINDIKSFFSWLQEVSLTKYAWDTAEKNLLNKINFSTIDEYKKRLIASKFSPLTINRKLSSLRNYIAWANSQGLIHSIAKSIPSPQPEIKIEINDKPNYSPFPPLRLMQKSLRATDLVFDNLFVLPLARIIENTQYLFWKTSGKKTFIKSKMKINPETNVSNIQKEFYAPLEVSARYLPTHKRIWHYIRYVRPNWYKKYHSYSFIHYLHFAFLIIFASAVGFGLYNGVFAEAQNRTDVLGASTMASPRILSFQGKLTDSANNPIIKDSDILFSIYSDSSSGPALWQETDSVKPDSDGAFSILLGKNNQIPDSLFTQNPKLFLGISVGNSPELTPRQQLITSSLANSSQTLQGLEPITNTTRVSNVVLALDSGGNLSIAGERSHTVQAIGGNLILAGQILSLTTISGSNSNVEIVPDGMGKIDLQKPIFNSSNDNNLSGVPGAVEFVDSVIILATTSAQSAFYINQNSTGPLISASTSGTAKFTVENDGTGFFAGGLGINGGNLTSTATTFNLLNSGVTTLNIGGAATTINLGVAAGALNIKSNLVVSKDISLSSFTSNGGILYTNGSGKVLQTSAGSSSDCFMGGSSPAFSPCANLFNNISTASISGNLTALGNVGIGIASPSAKFEIAGGQTKIEISTQYSQRLCHNGSADDSSTQNVLLGDCDASQADIAEYYGSKDITIEAGDIVIADSGAKAVGANSKAYVKKSDSSYQGSVIGIVSTNPYDAFGRDFDKSEYSFPVALAGRVPLKISLENGPIKAGDLLTSSSIPGVAMRSTKTGLIVGKALEDLNSIDESKAIGFYDPENKEYRSKTNFPNIPLKAGIIPIVKIYAFVNVSWHDPSAYLAENGDLILSTGSDGYSVANSKNEALENIGGFLNVVAGNIKTGLINASEVVTNSLIVTADSIIVNGQNLRDYIAAVVKQNNLVSPIQTNEISTNIISPLSSDSIIVKLGTPSGSLIVQNSSGSEVAKIDDQGNASFSGQLTANEASISGTLKADKIIADSFLTSHFSSDYADIASFSAQVAYVPNLQAEQGLFNQGLMVFGSTSLSDISVAGQLAIGGTMFVNNNSIDVLGTDLSLQSLKQGGLAIMGGLIYIDTDGNLSVKGDVSISGKLAVNIISPLPSSDLVINNASGSSVLSINQKGDIAASGSGTFAKLNFNLVQPALAVSDKELIASSSAGGAFISPYLDEVTIKNKLVTNDSVIYITPVGTPSAQSPFLMRQNSDSFTVGVESPNKNPIPFNWLIVN
ncbi:MAG: site-specific integrase [bacterium]|nr:site-specific integrase [bacterium]